MSILRNFILYYYVYLRRKKSKLKKKKINKACFQQDITKDSYKDLPARTASDKALHNKVFEFISYPKYDKCQRSFNGLKIVG